VSESLLDRLRSDGARVSRGGFSINREKAREKLSKFQLVAPHHYVLEFVQAAYLLDATYVDIDLDTDDMRMTFDGQTFDRRHLEYLYRAGFSRADTPVLRALRHVAIGVTAGWALDPGIFFVEVDDGTKRLRLMLSRDGDDEIEELDSLGESRTVIYLCENLRASHIIEYFRYLRDELAETVALREYCAHADIPILVNGESVSRGHRLRECAQGVVYIDTAHEKGRLGVTFDARIAQSHIQVLTNGVLATEVYGSEEPFGFDVVIDSNRLDKGLSQSEVVRNEAWHHVRDIVIKEALYRSLANYVRGIDDVTAATNAEALRQAAAWTWSIDSKPLDESLRRSVHQARAALRTARIWNYAHRSRAEDAGAHQTPLTSLQDLDRVFDGEAVPTSSWKLQDSQATGIPTSVLVSPKYRHIFEQTFGTRLRDVTADIQQAMQRIQRIHEFARRGKPRQPDPNYFMAHRVVDDGAFRAFLGIRVGDRRTNAGSTVKWTGQKLVLHERELGVAYPNLHIWINGPLVFQMESPHFKASRQYADLVEGVLDEVPLLVGEIVERLPPTIIVEWLCTLTDPAAHRRLARRLELPPQRIERCVEEDKNGHSIGWRDFTEPPPPEDDGEIASRIDALGPLSEVRTIELGLERRVSLAELLELHRQEGRLIRAARMFPQLSGPLAVTGGQQEVDLVERFFGPLTDADAEGEHALVNTVRSLSPQAPAKTPVRDERSVIDRRREPTSILEIEPGTTPPEPATPEPARPGFLVSIERTFLAVGGAWEAHDIDLEPRPGAPAALLDTSTCLINASHPIVAKAVEHPDSAPHQRWAETAVWTAIAAGGTRSERELAFEKLSDLVERA
jgi:hypothetical protein